MHGQINIRKAEKSDYQQLIRHISFHSVQQPDGSHDPHETIHRLNEFPDYSVYIAEHDYHIIITFTLLILDNLGCGDESTGVIDILSKDMNLDDSLIQQDIINCAGHLAFRKGCQRILLNQ